MLGVAVAVDQPLELVVEVVDHLYELRDAGQTRKGVWVVPLEGEVVSEVPVEVALLLHVVHDVEELLRDLVSGLVILVAALFVIRELDFWDVLEPRQHVEELELLRQN